MEIIHAKFRRVFTSMERKAENQEFENQEMWIPEALLEIIYHRDTQITEIIFKYPKIHMENEWYKL